MPNSIQASIMIGLNAGQFESDADFISNANVFIGNDCASNARNHDSCVVIGEQAKVRNDGTNEVTVIGRNAKAYNTGSVILGANVNDGDYSEAAIFIGELQRIVRVGTVLFSDAENLVLQGNSAEAGSGEANAEMLIAAGTPDIDVTGSALKIKGANATGTGVGGDVIIDAGENSDAGGFGGSVTLQGGYGEDTGGKVTIYGGSGNIAGGSADLIAGSGATGGGVTIIAGDGSAGDGGAITIAGGYGYDFGAGGAVNISAGEGVGGSGGILTLKAGASSAENSNGGEVIIYSGDGTQTGSMGGNVFIYASDGDDTGGNLIFHHGGGTNSGYTVFADSSQTNEWLKMDDTGIGFFNTAPVAQPTVTGNSAMEKADSLVAALAALGLIIDSTT